MNVAITQTDMDRVAEAFAALAWCIRAKGPPTDRALELSA